MDDMEKTDLDQSVAPDADTNQNQGTPEATETATGFGAKVTRAWKRIPMAGRVGGVCVLAVLAMVTPALAHEHEWVNATCTTAQICQTCNKVEGEPRGHHWAEATCTAPKTCSDCGETEGKVKEHTAGTWTQVSAATCSAQGKEATTCTKCGEELTRDIPRTEHTPGDWEVVKEYTIGTGGTVIPGTKARKCTACGAQVQTAEHTIKLSLSQQNCCRTADSYLRTLPFSHKGLVEQLEYEGYSHEESVFAADHCGADWNEQAVKDARAYLDVMSFSRSGLIEQLEFEGYTHDQAVYGVNGVGL